MKQPKFVFSRPAGVCAVPLKKNSQHWHWLFLRDQGNSQCWSFHPRPSHGELGMQTHPRGQPVLAVPLWDVPTQAGEMFDLAC